MEQHDVLEKMLVAIENVVAAPSYSLTGDRARQGIDDIIGRQGDLRRRWIDAIVRIFNHHGAQEWVHLPMQVVAEVNEKAAGRYQTSVTVVDETATINANCPIFLPDPVIDFEQAIQEMIMYGHQDDKFLEAARYAFTIFLENFRKCIIDDWASRYPIWQFPVISILGKINGRKAAAEILEKQSDHYRSYSKTINEFFDLTAAIKADTEANSKLLTSQKSKAEEVEEINNVVRNSVDGMKFRIETLEAELRETITLKETGNLWKGVAGSSQISYIISSCILIVLLASAPVVVYWHWNDLLNALEVMERSVIQTGKDNLAAGIAIATSRIALLVTPFAMFVWLVRLIVRFNLRSMLLMDDASQRVTMLNTYLFLIRKDAVTAQDRGVLLEAMFRRAPGHGPETIDPPNMADMLKYSDVFSGKKDDAK